MIILSVELDGFICHAYKWTLFQEENGCVQRAIQPREQREENYSYHTKTFKNLCNFMKFLYVHVCVLFIFLIKRNNDITYIV